MARTKGAIGRLNKDMKDCIELAFDRAGGVDYLLTVAKTDHKTFCALLARIVPASVAVSISHHFDLGDAMQIAANNAARLNAPDTPNTIEHSPNGDNMADETLQPKGEANVDFP